MSTRKPYYCNCVAWARPDLALLEELIEEGDDITYRDFASLVNKDELREMERNLGYGRTGLQMSEDYHVRYKLHRETGIPFAIHSAVEHVFATPRDIERLREIVGAKQLLDYGEPIEAPEEMEIEEDERELDEIDF